MFNVGIKTKIGAYPTEIIYEVDPNIDPEKRWGALTWFPGEPAFERVETRGHTSIEGALNRLGEIVREKESTCALPWFVARQTPDSLTVHCLHHGQPLCGFDPRAPVDWPKGNQWWGLEQWPPKVEIAQFHVCRVCDQVAQVALTYDGWRNASPAELVHWGRADGKL